MDEWMDVTQYRLDQFEKRADAADARMARIEDKLTEIQVTLAKVATTDNVRNWGLVVVAAILATGLSVGGLFLQSSSNQLSAFQSGLSAIQAITAAAQSGHAPSAKPGMTP
jgi:hypothetical protein